MRKTLYAPVAILAQQQSCHIVRKTQLTPLSCSGVTSAAFSCRLIRMRAQFKNLFFFFFFLDTI